jgi:hypothetical protein
MDGLPKLGADPGAEFGAENVADLFRRFLFMPKHCRFVC